MRNEWMVGAVLASLALATASSSPASAANESVSVSLPHGDAAKGKAVFASMRCYTCHEVAGADFPKPWASPAADMKLGGPGPAPDTGKVFTSIINPDHAISGDPKKTVAGGASRMGDFTDVLTVRQLVDVTAYVRSTYQPKK